MSVKKNLKSHLKKVKSHKHFNKGAVFAVTFGFIGLIVVLATFAATPTAQFEAESATLTTNATMVSDSNASGGQAVQFASTVTPPPPTTGANICTARDANGGVPVDKFPGDACVGIPSGTVLTAYTGPQFITTPGTTIDSKTLGDVCIQASNVTIRKSKVQGKIIIANGGQYGWCTGTIPTNIQIIDTEIVGPGQSTGQDISWMNFAVESDNYTCTRCKIHKWGLGFRVASNVTIADSYVTDMVGYEGCHPNLGSDCVAHRSCIGGNGVINSTYRHNNINCNNYNGQGGASGAIIAYAQPKVENLLIENNLIGVQSASYCLYAGTAGGTNTNIRVINNVFVKTAQYPRCGIYGPITEEATVVSGNVYNDGTPI